MLSPVCLARMLSCETVASSKLISHEQLLEKSIEAKWSIRTTFDLYFYSSCTPESIVNWIFGFWIRSQNWTLFLFCVLRSWLKFSDVVRPHESLRFQTLCHWGCDATTLRNHHCARHCKRFHLLFTGDWSDRTLFVMVTVLQNLHGDSGSCAQSGDKVNRSFHAGIRSDSNLILSFTSLNIVIHILAHRKLCFSMTSKHKLQFELLGWLERGVTFFSKRATCQAEYFESVYRIRMRKQKYKVPVWSASRLLQTL